MDKKTMQNITEASANKWKRLHELEAENVRLRANTTIDWTPEINRLRNEVVPAIEAERDEATAKERKRCAEIARAACRVSENSKTLDSAYGQVALAVSARIAKAIEAGEQ